MTSDAPEPGEAIDIPSVPNLRDLGGYPTGDGGTVRRGVLYRSTELVRLAGDDMASFARLGVRTVYDLRTEAERAAHPDRLPDGTELVVADVLRDSTDAAPAQLLAALSDPAAVAELLGGGRAVTLFEHGYREIVSLPSALAAYRRLFTDLATDARRPALFHCTTGKDRTGWAAAAILLLVGVPQDLVERDYLLSTTYLVPALQPVLDRFRSAGGDPALLLPVIGVEPAYLAVALEEMRARFGTVEGYFADGLGIDADGRRALRDALVAPGA